MRGITIALACVLAGRFLPGSYGPERDQSKFVTAVFVPPGRVVFAYHHLTYRPAKGMAAFPDGGIPKYTNDVHLLGVFDVAAGRTRVLFREKNKRWANGHGESYITQASDPLVLVNRGGQTRDLSGNLNEMFLLNIDDGTTREVRYREALAQHGQESRGTYLVSPQGHIVFVTAALNAGRSAEEGQIWLRSPDDTYRLVAPTRHYETFENGEIVYWLFATREFRAYNVTTHVNRSLPGYRARVHVDVTEGVTVQRDTVSLGSKRGGSWSYAPLPIDMKQLKR